MALLDITGGISAQSNQTQAAVPSDAHLAPLPDAFVSASMSQKLDADYYAATDTHDSADSLSGSGNLNFATLQAQQNDLLAPHAAMGEGGLPQDLTLSGLATGMASGLPVLAAGSTAFGNALGAGDLSEQILAGIGPQIAHAAGSLAALATSHSALTNITSPDLFTANGPIQSGSDGSSGINGTNGSNGSAGPAGPQGPAGQDGTNGTNGIDGMNGTEGSGGHDCGCGGSIIDIDIIGPINIGPIISGPILTGPIITGPLIDLGDVTQTLITVTHEVTNITNILHDILTPPAGGTGDTDLVIDLDIAHLPPLNDTLQVVLDPVEAIVGDIDVNLGLSGVLQGTDTTVSLDGSLLGSALPPVEISLPVTVESLLTDPAGAVQDVVTSLPDTLSGLTGGLTDGLTGPLTNGLGDLGHLGDLLTPPATGDTDLTIDLGLADAPVLGDALHVPLDPVEAIVGDIDINLGVTGVLQGTDTTVSLGGELLGSELPNLQLEVPTTVEDLLADPAGAVQDVAGNLPDTVATLTDGLTGSLTGGVDNGLGDILTPPASGDTDLNIDLGLADAPVLGDALHVPLDPVEAIVGDIDVNLGVTGVLQGTDTTVSLGGELLGTPLPDINLDIPTTVPDLLCDPVGAVQDVAASLPDTLGGLLGTGSDSTPVNDALDALTGSTGGGNALLGDLLAGTTEAVGGIADTLSGSLGGDSGGAWPESPVTGIVDNVVDSVLGGDGGAGSVLAPVGSVTEGLGLLDLGGHTGSTSGGHHGGLLGGLFG